jgi:hypothetical protein
MITETLEMEIRKCACGCALTWKTKKGSKSIFGSDLCREVATGEPRPFVPSKLKGRKYVTASTLATISGRSIQTVHWYAARGQLKKVQVSERNVAFELDPALELFRKVDSRKSIGQQARISKQRGEID